MPVTSAFNNSFSGQPVGKKVCSDVSVFMSCIMSMVEDMWWGS